MIAGGLCESNVNILLTGNVIKRQLRLPLSREEQDAEERVKGAKCVRGTSSSDASRGGQDRA